MSQMRQCRATLTRDNASKWQGASHSRATRFHNRALLYSMQLWRASKSRVKVARQSSRCDIGLCYLLCATATIGPRVKITRCCCENIRLQ